MQALSEKEILRLHESKVCVVGCGGLGGYIIEILARLGVLNITVVDFDVFETNNLNRQLFSTESRLGTSKTSAAIKRIASVNSDAVITGITERLDENNASDILKGHDIAVDALDNAETRLLISRTCRELGIPMVHGSIAGWYGQVASIFPGDNTLEKLFSSLKSERGIEKDYGNLPFTASAIASIQCAECVKILTGKETIRNALLVVDLLNGSYDVVYTGGNNP